MVKKKDDPLKKLNTMRRPLVVACGMAIALMHAGFANAQTRPDAGTLLQQIEQNRTLPLPPKSEPRFMPPPMKSLGDSSVTVTVTSFLFADNTLLSKEQLTPIVAFYLNRPLNFAELQHAAIAVATAYREAGWVVRAYLPEQDIQNSTLTIQIVEAVFGAVRMEGDPQRISGAQLTRIVESAQPLGQAINGDLLDRALLLIDDLPGLSVSGRLNEGQNQAETDLFLSVTDGRQIMGDIAVDNTGSRSTGVERLTANMSYNAPFRRGDLAGATFLHTEGSDYLRASYSLPLGSKGWRLGMNASHMAYKVVTEPSVGAQGTSTTAGMDANYPLIRSRLKNLYLGFTLDQKNFDNRDMNGPTTRYNTLSASVGLNGNLYDNFGGGGANTANITLVQGNVDLAGSPNEAADAASTQTAGSFNKLRIGASRQQVVNDSLSLYANLTGQMASKNLDSSEKFYLGGSSGVRAYPSSEGGGSEGYLLNLEARKKLAENLTLTAFYDWGTVLVNKNPVNTTALNRYDLSGVGMTIAWVTPLGLSIKATLARRIGDNPNPTPTGNDQDGSFNQNRFWLQASLPL